MVISDAEETVKVILVKEGYAYLETNKASACGSCASKTSCGSLNFFGSADVSNNKKSDKQIESGLKVLNTLNLKVGDSAVLAISSGTLLVGTFLLYILPLLSLMVFASIAKAFAGEIVSTMIGVIGFFVTVLFVRQMLNNQKFSNQFEPTLLRKVINIETK
ncbi:MAG: SoxR reducing system RseC family protein [Cocleimonas sp.]